MNFKLYYDYTNTIRQDYPQVKTMISNKTQLYTQSLSRDTVTVFNLFGENIREEWQGN